MSEQVLSEHARSIRERREALDARLNDAKRLVEHAALDLRHLRIDCKHENAYPTSHMGESCRDCPDCGACLQ